ncbi:MAG TPA: glycerate kinase [Acidimicrobiales bacterium]|nr:glycerate kinase [Acidimicrobiales bacterium]
MPDAGRPQPRLLAAPDKLKGTLTAAEAAGALAEAARTARWQADTCPLSDGGEGFAEALGALGGQLRTTTVTGPLGTAVDGSWRLAGRLGVVESAAASGLALVGGADGNDPMAASTRGTGELIMAALSAGARRVLVGVGGSATTDGGLGAIEAIEECGGWGPVEVVVACDVRTTFIEAADCFGPQKGATAAQVHELRRRLEDLADHYGRRYGVEVTSLAGSGAAGGLAGGLAALGARLVPGFELVAATVGLDDKLVRARLVVTAEGCLDASSWDGKVVGGVCASARRLEVEALVVAGRVTDAGMEGAARHGAAVISLSALAGERAVSSSRECLLEVVAEELRRRLQ